MTRVSALELAGAYARGERSPVEVIEDSLSQLDEAAALGAVQWRDDERARAAAGQAAERIARKAARPLEGIPWTAKEMLPIAGIPGLLALEPYASRMPSGSAWLAERMTALGAILVARTSSPELGALPTTENHRGACANPHDPSRTSGGSSGGAAVCASLGVAPLNHGNDGGGSVRIPAACCGVAGLKPSRGRITRGPFAGDGWAGLVAEGFLGASVLDLAWVLDLVHGPGLGDALVAAPPREPFLDAARNREGRLRIAVAESRDGFEVTAGAASAVRAAADRLADLGHEIVEDAPDLAPLEAGFGLASETGIAAQPLDEAERATLHPRVRHLWERGRQVPGHTLLEALGTMQRHARAVAAWFEGVDALLTPTLSGPAPVLGSLGADPETAWDDYAPFLQWTWPFNATGQPAISVPFGSEEGLPLGVQLAGRLGDESTILRLAAELSGE